MKINPNFKAGAQKGSTNYNERVTLIATPEGRFPPQAGKIIEALLAAKDYTLTVGELVGVDGSKESALEKAGLVTVQTPMDIWSHYKPRLVEENLVKIG
tara:strand:+ start:1707 stop:2003 length:297 start_codon:yes stop_codon:yes gene_type:complete